MSSNSYEADIVMWSEHQAAVLRRLAEGERVNDQVDWENVIEEIESVGNEQRHAVESLLLQALLHMLKAEAWPLSLDVPHWHSEARLFRAQAANRYAPSMRQRLNLGRIYSQAVRAVPDTIDGVQPLPVSAGCPVTLDELLSDEP